MALLSQVVGTELKVAWLDSQQSTLGDANSRSRQPAKDVFAALAGVDLCDVVERGCLPTRPVSVGALHAQVMKGLYLLQIVDAVDVRIDLLVVRGAGALRQRDPAEAQAVREKSAEHDAEHEHLGCCGCVEHAVFQIQCRRNL